ncbi:MAG: hypothetical protein LBE34_15655 [Flavobacteriaceae bacterium]|nr:hypothetical protein [Flavobacteriaceae bacterium]
MQTVVLGGIFMNRNYIKFLRKSRNQHSVHSPFVFCLLTKGLYPKMTQWRRYRKKDVFLYRLIAYFKPLSCFVLEGSEKRYKNELKHMTVHSKEISSAQEKVDMVLLQSSDLQNDLNLTTILAMMHNDSILVVDRRIKTPVGEELWDTIVQNKVVTASIDFYYFGVAFIREEQLKQHFILRM